MPRIQNGEKNIEREEMESIKHFPNSNPVETEENITNGYLAQVLHTSTGSARETGSCCVHSQGRKEPGIAL